jgi:hypothetical protein
LPIVQKKSTRPGSTSEVESEVDTQQRLAQALANIAMHLTAIGEPKF